MEKFHRSGEAKHLPPRLDVSLPSINEVPVYSPSGSASGSQSIIRFQILADAYQGKKRHSNRFIYVAEADVDGFSRTVLIKLFLTSVSVLSRAGLCTTTVRSWCPSRWLASRYDGEDRPYRARSKRLCTYASLDLVQGPQVAGGWVHGNHQFASRSSRRNYRQGRPGRVILVNFDWSGCQIWSVLSDCAPQRGIVVDCSSCIPTSKACAGAVYVSYEHVTSTAREIKHHIFGTERKLPQYVFLRT